MISDVLFLSGVFGICDPSLRQKCDGQPECEGTLCHWGWTQAPWEGGGGKEKNLTIKCLKKKSKKKQTQITGAGLKHPGTREGEQKKKLTIQCLEEEKTMRLEVDLKLNFKMSHF